MGHRLEGLTNAGLGKRVGSGSRLAKRVTRIPDDILELSPSLFRSDEAVHDRITPVGASRDKVAGRDNAGDLLLQRRPVDMIRPSDISRLDR